MHRFFWEGARLDPGNEVDLTELHHQVWRVLRLRNGDQIVLLDNSGGSYPCEITSAGPSGATGRILERVPVVTEPQVQLVLYQCMLKGDKLEWVLQKCTELGVARFVPVVSRRAIVQSAAAVEKKFQRWRSIIREAAEQSGRGQLPELDAPMEWTAVAKNSQGLRLLPWEGASGAMGIVTQLSTLEADGVDVRQVSLLVGPEGGLEQDEVDLARRTGWQIVTMGRRILRAETAAVAATTMVMSWAHELGS